MSTFEMWPNNYFGKARDRICIPFLSGVGMNDATQHD
jgi:hypothetical protein